MTKGHAGGMPSRNFPYKMGRVDMKILGRIFKENLKAIINRKRPDHGSSARGLHRCVRHPLYSAGFMILWGLLRDPLSLAMAIWGSLYLVIGTRFEERKLRRLYGAAYDDYSKRVPPSIAWPRPKP